MIIDHDLNRDVYSLFYSRAELSWAELSFLRFPLFCVAIPVFTPYGNPCHPHSTLPTNSYNFEAKHVHSKQLWPMHAGEGSPTCHTPQVLACSCQQLDV